MSIEHGISAQPAQKTNAGHSAQLATKLQAQISKIYADNRSKESQLISDLLKRVGHGVSSRPDLTGIINTYFALAKIAPEYVLDSTDAKRSPRADRSLSAGMQTSRVDQIAATIQSMLGDGVNSFEEMGQLIRLVGMAGGQLNPGIVSDIKQGIGSFLKSQLGSEPDIRDAIKVLSQIQGTSGGNTQAQDLIREIEEMLNAFLQNHEQRLRDTLMTHLADTASDKLKDGMNTLLDAFGH